MNRLPDEFKPTWTKYKVESETDPELLEYVDNINYLKERLKAGDLYIKFVDGDRKGAIARLELDPKMSKDRPCAVKRRYDNWGKTTTFEPEDRYLYAIARWDKRSNKAQFHSHSNDYVFLPNYTGPTVWALFDKKAAKTKIMEELDIRDRDGQKLEIGDKVVYINLRYGSGGQIDHGTIKEFKVYAAAKTYRIETIVERDEDFVQSTINYPENMIYKKV